MTDYKKLRAALDIKDANGNYVVKKRMAKSKYNALKSFYDTASGYEPIIDSGFIKSHDTFKAVASNYDAIEKRLGSDKANALFQKLSTDFTDEAKNARDKYSPVMGSAPQKKADDLSKWFESVNAFSDKTSSGFKSREGVYQKPEDILARNEAGSGEIDALLKAALESRDFYSRNAGAYDELYGKGSSEEILKSIQDGIKYLNDVNAGMSDEYDSFIKTDSKDPFGGGRGSATPKYADEAAYQADQVKAAQYEKDTQRNAALAKMDLDATKGALEIYTSQLAEIDRNIEEAQVALSNGDPKQYTAGMENLIKLREKREALQQQSNDLNKTYSDAEKIQTAGKYDELKEDPEFGMYSNQGAAVENPTTDEANDEVQFFGWSPFGKEVKNKVAYGRDNYDKISESVSKSSDSPPPDAKYLIYNEMTDDEVKTYNYILGKDGAAAADQYLADMQETLNYRAGSKEFESIKDNTLAELFFGMAAGGDQFKSGVSQLFSEDALPTSAKQYASGMVREDLADDGAKLPDWLGGASLAQGAYDLASTGANMAPSLLLGAITGGLGAPAAISGAVGSATLGLSAGGNAYKESLDAGYTKEQARDYATLIGASEGGLQYLMGGIGKLGGVVSGGFIENAVRNIDSAFLRIAAEGSLKMLAEGTEEYLQEILNPMFKNLAYGEKNAVPLATPEAAYSFILGALSAGVLGGSSNVSNTMANKSAGTKVINDGNTDSLVKAALTLDPSTGAYKLAQGISDGKTHASKINIGKLLSEYQAIDPLMQAAEEMVARQARAQEPAQENKTGEYTSTPGVPPQRGVATAQNVDGVRSPNNVNIQNDGISHAATFNDESAAPLTVTGIDSVEGGSVFVRDAEGVKVALNDITIDDTNIERLYSLASQFDTEAAKAFVSAYDDKLPLAEHFGGFKSIYNSAMKGMARSEAFNAGIYAPRLPLTVQEAAYNAGQNVQAVPEEVTLSVEAQPVSEKTDSDTAPEKQSEKQDSKPINKGNVIREYKGKTTKAQDAHINAVGRFLSAVGKGRDVVIEDTFEGKQLDGVVLSAGINAYFDPRNNSYHIALDSIGQAYMYFAVHETIHDIAKNNKAGYARLRELVLDTVKEKGQNLDDLLKIQQKKHSAFGTEYWIEEVVANTVPVILTDEQTMTELAERIAGESEDVRSAFLKLLDKIKAMLQKAYNILKGEKSWQQMEVIEGDMMAIANMREAYWSALDGIQAGENGGEVRMSAARLNPDLASRVDVEENYDKVAAMEPVAELTGDEFKKSDIGIIDQVEAYFNSIGKKARNPLLGDIILDRRGVKSDVGHKLGRNKSISFAAVPAVIENGEIVDIQYQWKGKNKDTVVIAAPITISGTKYFSAVIVEKRVGSDRFYLHEVIIAEQNNAASPFKTANPAQGRKLSEVTAPIFSILRKLVNIKQNQNENSGGEMPMLSLKDGNIVRSVYQQKMQDEAEPGEHFSTKYTGMSYYDDMIEDPKYYLKSKNKEFRIIRLSPKQYLLAVTKGFKGRRIAQMALDMDKKPLTTRGAVFTESDLVEEYTYLLQQGEVFTMPFLNYSEGWFEQEGRHRAKAAINANIDDMPVMIVSDSGKINDAVKMAMPTSKNDIRFAMNDAIEDDGKLIAIHNLYASKMRDALRLGGFPMPSIAVTKPILGHENFGDISLIFKRDTIDPAKSSENKVYSGDAWTPTFPSVEYKVNEKAVGNISRKIKDIMGGYNEANKYGYMGLDDDNVSDYARRHDGDVKEAFKDKLGLKEAYLKQKGINISPVMVEKRVSDRYDNDMLRAVLKEVGADEINRLLNSGSQDQMQKADELKAIGNKYFVDKYGAGDFFKKDLGFSQVDDMLRGAKKLAEDAAPMRLDESAMQKEIDSKLDKKGYDLWLADLFDGIIEKKGIYNGAERYTYSGNRKSFEALHWEITLDNIVKAMKKEDPTGSGAFIGATAITGVATESFKSVAAMKKDSGRLVEMDDEAYSEAKSKIMDRLAALSSRIIKNTGSDRSNFSATLDAGDAIVDVLKKARSPFAIYNAFKQWSMYEVDMDVAKEIYQLYADTRNMPSRLFEAKPRRVVGFEEVAAAIMPKGEYGDIKNGLKERGIQVHAYDKNIEGDRLRVLNSAEIKPLRFSLRDTSDFSVQRLESENVKLTETLDVLKQQFELTKGHKVSDRSLNQLANRILREYKSAYSQETLVENLRTMYDYLANAEQPAWEEVSQMGVGMAKSIIEQSSALDKETYEHYADVRKYLRETRIRMSETQRAEAAYVYGSYRAYRQSLFGNVNIVNDGVWLDVVWQELSKLHPELFDADISDADMPQALMAVVETMKPQYVNPFGYNMNEASYDLFLHLHDTFFSLPEVKTYADKQSDKMMMLKAQYQNKIADLRDTSRRRYYDRLKALRIENSQKRKDLLAKYNDAKTKKQTEYANRLRDQYKALTDKMNEKLFKQKASFQEWKQKDRARRTEQSEKVKHRESIENNLKDMYAWMMRPTNKKHVPEVMREMVSNFLESVDMVGSKDTKKAARWLAMLDGLRYRMAQMDRLDDGYSGQYADFAPDFIPRLEAFIDVNRDVVSVENMDAVQLKELAFLVNLMKKGITEANRLHANKKYMEIAELGNATVSDLSNKRAASNSPFAKLAKKAMMFAQMDFFSYFGRLGDAAASIGESLRNGLDAKIKHIREAVDFMQKALKGANIRELSGERSQVKTFRVIGGELKLTIAQIMELYLLNQRPQARGHLYNGGIKSPDIRAKDGNKTISLLTGSPVRVSVEDVNRITGTLTHEQKAIADAMQRFVSEHAARWGNDAAMILYGYKIFTEENYWTIKSDTSFTTSNDAAEQLQALMYAIRNMGMTKATIEGASNPIMLGDVFDTFTRHVDEMATYSAFLVPLSDAMRWYNFRDANVVSVKQSLKRAMGNEGTAFFERFIKDLNGIVDSDFTTGMAEAFVRNAKTGAVWNNLRVVVQQFASWFRAGNEIGLKHMLKGVIHKRNFELAKKYAPIIQWKAWGFFDLNISRSLREIITGDTKVVQQIKQRGMWMAQTADNITLAALWAASESEIQATRKDLKPDSEEYYQAVGARLSRIVDRTQVVDSVFHRSQIMRAKGLMPRMATAFMTEPIKSYNMLLNAFSAEGTTKQKWMAVTRAMFSFLATQTAAAAFAAVIDAFRTAGADEDDDGEEDTWLQRYINAFGGNIVNNINPLNMIPYVKDMWSLAEGFTSSRMDMQGAEQFIGVVGQWIKSWSGESKWSTYKLIYESVRALSSITGIGVGNLMRDFNGIYNTFSGEDIDMKSENATVGKTYATLYDAMLAGDDDKAAMIRNYLATDKDSPKSPRDIDTALAKLLMEKDPRIIEAYNAKAEADIAKLNGIISQIQADGFSVGMVRRAINQYENSLDDSEEEKDMAETLDEALYDYTDLFTAIREGGEDDIDAIRNELISDSDAKDPEASVREEVTTEFKPEYVSAILEGDTNTAADIAEKMQLFGVTEEKMTEWVLDDQSAKMKEAVLAEDISGANAYIAEQINLGRTEGSIKGIITNAMKPLVIEAYESEGWAAIPWWVDQLSQLELYNTDEDSYAYGWSYYYQDKIEGWIDEYLEQGSN